ncbi:MAG: hypothetical protein AB7J28_09825 [Hyphomonadaceae bacterium]
MFRRLRSAWDWDRAKVLSRAGRYQEALEVARYGDEQFRQRAHWKLFVVHQLGLMKNNVRTLAEALALIQDLRGNHTMSGRNQYFLAFAQWYGRVAFRRLYPGEPLPKELDSDPASVDLSVVPKRWMRVFPMPIHPHWVEL